MVEKTIAKVMVRCEGWCSFSKAMKIVSLFEKYKPKLSVEIGVYGGRSLIPQAIAHKLYNTNGMAIGIDPWKTDEAYQPGIHRSIDEVPKQEMFDSLFRDTCAAITEFGVGEYVSLLRFTSEAAMALIPGEIDFLHIDGNHTEGSVAKDFFNYYPMVKSGGIVWFDDADWPTIQPTIKMAKSMCASFEDFDAHNTFIIKR